MQFADNGYRQLGPRPTNHGVRWQWIGEAWDIYRVNVLPWIVLYLILGAPLVMTAAAIVILIHSPDTSSGSSSSSGSDDMSDGLAILLAGGLFIGQCLVGFALVCSSCGVALSRISGEMVRPSQIFAGMNRWIAMLVFTLILTLALLVGAIALGLGLFVAMGLMMPGFALVASGESAGRAFVQSVAAMKRDWFRASLFCLVFTLLALVGSAITLGLGLFVFVPMMYIVSALAYRDCIVNAAKPGIELEHLTAQAHEIWPPAPARPNDRGEGQ